MMQQTTVLDIGTVAEFADPPRRTGMQSVSWRAWVPLVLAALGLALYLGGGTNSARLAALFGGDEPAVRAPVDRTQQVEAMTVDDKAQIVAEGVVAAEQNAAIPVSTLPLENVGQFLLANAAESNYATALRCLTQGVYYEAANEPMQGRQAVAQVILNRMRHPAYPKSVCGVVYQGSERRTGCQFSFTCDGSLLRTPMVVRWREAEAVARAALGGFVEPSVGTATHYHADYVLPKWAFQLAKIEQLGRHIFYRFPGQWGKAPSFNGRYSGTERLPSLDYAALQLRAGEEGMLLPLISEPLLTPGLTVEPAASDRHAPADVGGRLDMTKTWRLSIPDPGQASSRYRAALVEDTKSGTEDGRVAETVAKVEPGLIAERP